MPMTGYEPRSSSVGIDRSATINAAFEDILKF